MSENSTEEAIKALRCGLEHAEKLNEPSSIAICDAGGSLIAFCRSTDAAFGSVEVAIGKAYTAAAFRTKTADLLQDSQPGGEFYSLVAANPSRPFVVFGGGTPVVRGGVCVGAVGVSGGPVAADVEIAAVVCQALEG